MSATRRVLSGAAAIALMASPSEIAFASVHHQPAHTSVPTVSLTLHRLAEARSGAGSLVYVKRGDIYLAHTNGKGKVVVRKGHYRWPSMDNKGHIAALAPDGITAPDGSAGYSIFRLSQSGRKLSRVATPSDYSTVSCINYPASHVNVSPDGSKVAYDFFDCSGRDWATWTRSAGGMNLHRLGDYTAPDWRTNKDMLVSHFGQTVTTDQAEIGLWRTNGSSAGWSTSIADSWATAYHATTTANGKKLALIEDDAANWLDGKPRKVRILLATTAGPLKAITPRCSIRLPVSQYDGTRWGGATYASLSFSPNGSALIWDGENGLYRANTANLGDCTTLKPHFWIKGAWDGSFSAATDNR